MDVQPLPENDFWALVELLGGSVDQGLDRLADELARQGPEVAEAFQRRLVVVLHDLDREVLSEHPVRWVDAPDEPPLGFSDDTFLYWRAGVVARGRAVRDALLADPGLVASGLWEDGEALLTVAEHVLGHEVETELSYETGSNPQRWVGSPVAERAFEGDIWDVVPQLFDLDVRDLLNPHEGESWDEEGNTVPFQVWSEPDYTPWELTRAVAFEVNRAVHLHGGLPEGLRAGDVTVQVDVSDHGHREPEIGDWQEGDGMFTFGTFRPVRVVVDDAVLRALGPEQRHELLLGLAADGVLAVLGLDHAARPELERMRAEGSRHLP